MSIIGRLLGRKKEEKRETNSLNISAFDRPRYRVTRQGIDRFDINEREFGVASYYGPVHRSIALITHSLSSLLSSKHLYISDERGEPISKVSRMRMLRLFRNTMNEGETTAKDFWSAAFCNLLLTGNSLIYIQDRERFLFRLASPVHSQSRRNQRGRLFYDLTLEDTGEVVSAPVNDVIHLRMTPTSDLGGTRWGMSPTKVLATHTEIGMNADEYVNKLIGNGPFSLDNKILHSEMGLTNAQVAKLKESVKKKNEEGGPVVTIGDLTIYDIIVGGGIPGSILETRTQEIELIAQYYGIPAPLMGVNLTQWGSGIETLTKIYASSCLEVYLSAALAQLSLRLLSENEYFDIPDTAKSKIAQESVAPLIMAVNGDAQRDAVMSVREIRNDILGYPGDLDQDDRQNEFTINREVQVS